MESALSEPAKPTRWAEIATDLAEAIQARRYPVDSLLPSETALAATYGVSRFTVREALRRLSERGLISRRHGSGSRVVSSLPRPAYALAVDSESDVLRYAAATTIRVADSVREATGAQADLLGLGNADDWMYLTGVRESRGKRIGAVEVYLRREYRAVLDELGSPVAGAIYQHILSRYGLTLKRIEQTIGATILKPVQARRLRAETGEPALRIVRRFHTEEAALIEVSVSVHPASRFEYTLNIDA